VHGERDELMGNTAAYSGLRWGELAALTVPQVNQGARVIAVDRKVIEVAGRLYVEAPKNRKHRRTIYPRSTPAGYPLAERLAARIEEARAEMEAGTNPPGLIFPSPRGKHWRSSNFDRRVLAPAYLVAGWRDADGNGRWTWHSLRHVFCTTALFTWKLDPTDVSAWPGTPTTASRSTCTSVPPPASSPAPALPPSSNFGRYEGPGAITHGASRPAPPWREQHAGHLTGKPALNALAIAFGDRFPAAGTY
jgi:hypothetical protein